MSEAVLEYPAGLTVQKKRRQTSSDPRWLPVSLKMEIERLLIQGLSVRQVVITTKSTIGSVARCRKHLIELRIVKPKSEMPKKIWRQKYAQYQQRYHQQNYCKPAEFQTATRLVVPKRQIAETAFGPIPLTRLMAGR